MPGLFTPTLHIGQMCYKHRAERPLRGLGIQPLPPTKSKKRRRLNAHFGTYTVKRLGDPFSEAAQAFGTISRNDRRLLQVQAGRARL